HRRLQGRPLPPPGDRLPRPALHLPLGVPALERHQPPGARGQAQRALLALQPPGLVGRAGAVSPAMARFLVRRLAAALLLLFLVLSITFFLVHIAPGDPVTFFESRNMTPEQHARLLHLYGLDRPLPVQYLDWLKAVALHGDWGISFSAQRPVAVLIGEALPATLLLAVAALVFQYGLGILLGVAAARRPGSAADHLIRILSLLFYSQPVFWLGLM